MKKFIKDFCLAILAGVMIGIGGVVFLSIENPVIGSVLFATGLLTILAFKLNLFTGKAPYMCQNNLKYCGFVGLVWLGNFIGTGLTALLIRSTKIYDKIITRCAAIAVAKVEDTLISLFILGVLCGILMYIAVDTYNKQSQDKNFSATVLTIFCVSVFILSGFEHSVADMFYFMLVLPITQWFIPLVVISIGNILGGNAFCLINKIISEKGSS